MAAPTDYIAYYKLANDANDETGNYNGTAVDGVSFNGEGAVFDGYLDHIETRSQAVTNNFTDLSISCWFTLAESKTYSTLFGRWADDGTLMVRMDGTTLKIFFYSNGSFVLVDSYVLSLGVQYFFAIVHESNVLSYYIDTVSIDSVPTNGIDNIGTSPQGIEIGGYYSYSGNENRVFSGVISNFRIYNYALTSQEITDIYNSEGQSFVKDIFSDVSEDIVRDWTHFLDTSRDLIPTYQTFSDVSEDAILSTYMFQDISVDHQGYIQIFSDVSVNTGGLKWSRFYDISNDEPTIFEDILIKRVNS